MSKITLAICCALILPSVAFADPEASALRAELELQRDLVQQQMKMLQAQQATIENLSRRVTELEGGMTLLEMPVIPSTEASAPAARQVANTTRMREMLERDSEGDLNRGSAAVQAGDLEGTFKIPGRDNVSISLGGFAKTVAYANSEAENQGAVFLPGLLGLERDDPKGNFDINPNLSRTYLSAAAH